MTNKSEPVVAGSRAVTSFESFLRLILLPVLFVENKSPKPRPLLTPSDRQVGILRQSKIFLSGALPKKR